MSRESFIDAHVPFICSAGAEAIEEYVAAPPEAAMKDAETVPYPDPAPVEVVVAESAPTLDIEEE